MVEDFWHMERKAFYRLNIASTSSFFMAMVFRLPTNILQWAPRGSLVTLEAWPAMLGAGACGLIGPGPGPSTDNHWFS